MRIVAVVGVAVLLGVLPAAAQTTCRITNTADGKESFVSGDVTGTSLAMLVTENGPFAGKLTLDAGSAYKAAPGGAPVLKVFRAGNSVEGKDWREPGSVETLDGGLLMSWPAFSLSGAEVRNLTVGLSSGWTTTRQTFSHPAVHTGPTAIFLRLDGRLAAPANSVLIETDYAETTQWRNAALARRAVFKVDVFDEDAGVHIATIDFTIPDAEPTQARLISDVTALRRAVAEKTCK
ncbi:MAG: hypothetical protein ABMA14_05310 [Hyphomonadaceae bacterium]